MKQFLYAYSSIIFSVIMIQNANANDLVDEEEVVGICDQLSIYAATIPLGEKREITIGRKGRWLVDHVKFCQNQGDKEAKAFCSWLLENTSTEFWEVNITNTIACLSGFRTEGYIGNTGVDYWAGKMSFYSNKLDVEGVDVEIEYSMKIGGENGWSGDFLTFRLFREAKQK